MRRLVVAAAALVALGFLVTPSVTGALWRAQEDLGTTAVQTGDLVLLNGNATTQVSTYAFTELTRVNMGPGSFAQAPLTLRNGGSADLRYRLAQWTSTSPALQSRLVLTATSVPSAAACPAPGAGAQPGTAIDPAALRALPVGTSEVVCLRFTLDPQSTPPPAGTSGTITLTWFAEQDL